MSNYNRWVEFQERDQHFRALQSSPLTCSVYRSRTYHRILRFEIDIDGRWHTLTAPLLCQRLGVAPAFHLALLDQRALDLIDSYPGWRNWIKQMVIYN